MRSRGHSPGAACQNRFRSPAWSSGQRFECDEAGTLVDDEASMAHATSGRKQGSPPGHHPRRFGHLVGRRCALVALGAAVAPEGPAGLGGRRAGAGVRRAVGRFRCRHVGPGVPARPHHLHGRAGAGHGDVGRRGGRHPGQRPWSRDPATAVPGGAPIGRRPVARLVGDRVGARPTGSERRCCAVSGPVSQSTTSSSATRSRRDRAPLTRPDRSGMPDGGYSHGSACQNRFTARTGRRHRRPGADRRAPASRRRSAPARRR